MLLLEQFSFYKANNSLQGTQDKLLVCIGFLRSFVCSHPCPSFQSVYMATVIAFPATQQMQVLFLRMRGIYEIRERPSRMYSWTALITSQFLVESPWNILGDSLFFFCWYWTIGYPSSRAGYTYLVFCVIFPLYYTSCAQAIAAMAPSPEIAGLIFSVVYSYVLML
jgi:ATP-binding cassette subfamily G (WHITE) protein 2 (SNQ2)